MKDRINAACDWASAAKNIPNSLSTACTDLLVAGSKQIQNTNMYNIYGDCVNNNGCTSSGLEVGQENLMIESLKQRYTVFGPKACIDSRAASGYLNQADVQAAIHVQPINRCWSVCSTPSGWRYTSTARNLPRDTYPYLIDNLRVLIFNGDWDACVPYTDNEAWTTNMGYAVSNDWHLWTYTSTNNEPDQVAGYAVTYTTGGTGLSAFTFATVKGGRHEVPESAPAQGLELLSRLINGVSF
jgi:hypothetical protein